MSNNQATTDLKEQKDEKRPEATAQAATQDNSSITVKTFAQETVGDKSKKQVTTAEKPAPKSAIKFPEQVERALPHPLTVISLVEARRSMRRRRREEEHEEENATMTNKRKGKDFTQPATKRTKGTDEWACRGWSPRRYQPTSACIQRYVYQMSLMPHQSD